MKWIRNVIYVVVMVTGDDVDTEWRVDADGRPCLSELPGRRRTTQERTRTVPGRHRGQSHPNTPPPTHPLTYPAEEREQFQIAMEGSPTHTPPHDFTEVNEILALLLK